MTVTQLLGLGSAAASQPNPASSPRTLRVPPASLVGCYALTLGPWLSPNGAPLNQSQPHSPDLATLPQIELRGDRSSAPVAGHWILLPPPTVAPFASATWTVVGDTLELEWPTGGRLGDGTFVARLLAQAGEYRGRGTFETDYLYPLPYRLISARRVTCAIEGFNFREWAAEARVALAAAPQTGEERLSRLVSLQVQAGDIEGARETARALSRTWVPFSRIAVAQRRRGDVRGAIESANLAFTANDRSQALGSVAAAVAGTGDFDQAEAIVRTIPWPREQVERLKGMAKALTTTDISRARRLLREAREIAVADASSWGRYFEVDLVFDQAAVGDLEGVRQGLAEKAEPTVRVNQLVRVAQAIRRTPIERAAELSDSLLHLASASAQEVVDSAPRRLATDLVNQASNSFRKPPSGGPVDQPRMSAVDSAIGRLLRGLLSGDPAEIAAVGPLGDDRRVANAVVARLTQFDYSRELHQEIRPAVIEQAERLAKAAAEHAGRVSPAFEDSTRLRMAYTLAYLGAPASRGTVLAIRDRNIRSSGLLVMAWTRLALSSNPNQGLDLVALVDPSVARDSFYVAATVKLAHTLPDDAKALTVKIDDPSRRAIAQMVIASVRYSSDTTAARAEYIQALPLVDALGPGLAPNVLQGPLRAGEHELVRRWARGQLTAEGRAVAFLAILEAAMPDRL